MNISNAFMRASGTRAALMTALCLSMAACAVDSYALDFVLMERGGEEIHTQGKLLLEAQDGGMLLQAADGTLWAIQPDEVVKHTTDESPFIPSDAEALSGALIDELGDGFKVHTTAHYVIAYNTSRAYAQWCGALYERLYSSFYTYWKHRGVELKEPEQPLVAVVFDTKANYTRYARPELGDAVTSIIGYYNLQKNRVAMFDLTSTSAHRGRLGTSAQINAVLAKPQAFDMVATIIHEATHQLAFNSGLHQRLADIPLWFSEGFAMYFETPDLTSRRGWAGIGDVNRPRLVRFRQSLRTRKAGSLEAMLSSDEPFRNTKTALNAYAEAWALHYYLIKRYPDEYDVYLKMLSEKGPLLSDTPEERIRQFRAAFGVDLDTLEREFLKAVRAIR